MVMHALHNGTFLLGGGWSPCTFVSLSGTIALTALCLCCTRAQVHAENGEGVALGQQAVFDAGVTGPEGHALSRPAVLEGEATARAIKLADFVGVPLYVVHVMSTDAMEEVGVGCTAVHLLL